MLHAGQFGVMYKVLGYFGLSMTVIGCSTFHESYRPPDWPSIQHSATTCRHLVGEYKDEGVPSPANENPNYRPLLSIEFNVFAAEKVDREARRISLEFLSENELKVAIFNGTNRINQKLIRLGNEFQCRDGKLYYSVKQEGHSEGQTYKAENVLILAKASDGSLIAQMTKSGKYSYMFVPSTKHIENWYLFQKTQ